MAGIMLMVVMVVMVMVAAAVAAMAVAVVSIMVIGGGHPRNLTGLGPRNDHGPRRNAGREDSDAETCLCRAG